MSLSNQIKAVGKRMGFECELRNKPPEGGIVERLFKTINTKVLETLPGYIAGKDKDSVQRSEKTACLTFPDVDRILAGFFCDDYNHGAYPKDPKDTRYERWLRGMGGKLPDSLEPRELDTLLMKEEQCSVQAHGSIYFKNLTYRCEELKPYQGEFVSVRYDPDHILTLLAYSLDSGEASSEFIGYVHAINMDMQDLSLEELKHLNKCRSNAKRQHSNYDALLALDKRQKLAEERKQEKKQKQRSEQRKLRKKDKQDSKVVELRQRRKGKASNISDDLELLPERIERDQILPPEPNFVPAEPAPPTRPQSEDRHKVVIRKNCKLKRIW